MCVRLPKPLNPNAEAWSPKQIAPPASPQPAIPVFPYPAAIATYNPSYSIYKMSQLYYLPLTSSRIFFPVGNGCLKPTSNGGEEISIPQKNSKSQNARKADGPTPLDGFKKGVRRHLPPRFQRPVRSVYVDKNPPNLCWRPRKLAEPDKEAAVDAGAADFPPPRVSLPLAPLSGQGMSPSWNTTVMIKNIPNRLRLRFDGFVCVAISNIFPSLKFHGTCKQYPGIISPICSITRDDILKFLDGYCCAYSLEYDFLYLPMDFRKKGNLGYAFVNFTTAIAANKFKKILQNFKWETVKSDSGSFISKKICEITWARIQGKEVYTRRFKNSEFACRELDFLPVVLDPPRNGSDPNPCPPLVLGNIQLQRRFSS